MKVPVKNTTTTTTTANRGESAIDLQEDIRRRAYELYERRGGRDGHDIEDWLQAEAELAQERTMAAARIAVKITRKPAVASAPKVKAKRVKKPTSPAQTKTSEN
jgi:hypothetical protein